MIYLLREAQGNRYKIGYTSGISPEGRRSGNQTGNSRALHVVATFPGTREDEGRLHQVLSRYRIPDGGREWFALDVPSLVALILELMVREQLPEVPETLEVTQGEYGPVKVRWGPLAGQEGQYQEDITMLLWEVHPDYRNLLAEEFFLDERQRPVVTVAHVQVWTTGESLYLPHRALE